MTTAISNPKASSKPENVTWLSPHITVSDVDKMANFYEKAFNFTKLDLVPGDDGSTWHGEMRYKDQMIMLGKAGAYNEKSKPPFLSGLSSPVNLYLYCEDVDQFYKHAITSGAVTLLEPQDMFWGDRMCRLKDPEGFEWCFASFLGERK